MPSRSVPRPGIGAGGQIPPLRRRCGLSWRRGFGCRLLQLQDFLDQAGIIICEDSPAVAARPFGGLNFDVIPIHRTADTHHLKPLAAGSLHDLHIFGRDWKVHFECLLPGLARATTPPSAGSTRAYSRAASYRRCLRAFQLRLQSWTGRRRDRLAAAVSTDAHRVCD